jgi:hypothetical protein
MTVIPKSRGREELIMKRNAISPQRTIVAGGVAALILVSSNVLANNADTTMDLEVTLSPVMTITCTPLKFGELFVPIGSRENGVTDISFSPGEGGLNPGGGANEVTFGEGSQPGTCTVSNGPGDTDLDITFEKDGSPLADGGPVNLGSGGDAEVQTPGSLTIAPELVSAVVTTDGSGSGSFDIGGTISIPDNLSESNYGEHSATITVIVTDNT